MNKVETKRAAIYVRISLERHDPSESPENQEAECRRLAAQRGWTVVKVFSDRDKSAYKKGVRRPGYEALIRSVRSGEADMILTWKTDRITRQGVTGMARLLEVLDATGAGFVSATQQFIDTTTPIGRGILGLLASHDEQSSADTSERVRLQQGKAAARGERHGGGYRTFGLRERRRTYPWLAWLCEVFGATVDPENQWVMLPDDRGPAGSVVPHEADAIRAAMTRLLAGDSCRSIARDLNARGIRTTTGKEWSARTLANTLRSPALARLVPFTNDAGDRKYANGEGEPIITEVEHLALVTALGQRARTPIGNGESKKVVDRTTGGMPLADRRQAAAKYLLAGLATCGRCGCKMYRLHSRQPRTKDNRYFEKYQCMDAPGRKACGRVTASMNSVDAFVTAEALRLLAGARLRPEDGGADEAALEKQLAEDQEALAELVHERFVRRTIPADAFEPARADLQRRIDDAAARLEAVKRLREEQESDLPLGDAVALQRWWDAASQPQRNAAMRQTIERVAINPAKSRGGNRFDTNRVVITFKPRLLWNYGKHTDVSRFSAEELEAGELAALGGGSATQ